MPKAKAVSKESEYSVIESPPANQNIGLMAKIDAALQTVMEHPVFSDVTLQAPLSVSAAGRNSGYQAGFDATLCDVALKSVGKYRCAANLFWLALGRVSNPMVPIYERNISQLQQTFFKEPEDMPYTIIVPVDPGWKAADIMQRRGNLPRISPEEPEFAFVLCIAERIRQCADQAELRRWKNVGLRSTFEFRVVAEDMRASMALNERRLFFVGYETLTRGTIAMFFQIVDFKHSYEKSNPPLKDSEVAAEYKKTLQRIDSLVQDDVTDRFVAVAIKVYNKILSKSDCLALIMEEENLRGKKSIYNNGMTILEQVCKKCPTHEHVFWALSSIKFLVKCSYHHPTDFNTRLLSGKGSASKGDLVMYIVKYDFLAWLSSAWMKSIGFHDEDIKMLRTIDSHERWLERCGGDGTAVDISWQGFLRPSMRKLLSVVETLVFSIQEDAAWRNALKGSIDVKEVVEAEPFKNLLAEVEALVVKEKPVEQIREEQTAADAPVVALQGFHDYLSKDAVAKLSTDQEEALEDFSRLCDKRVDQFWTSVVDGKNRLELKTALENTILANLPMKADETLLLWLDSKQAGEASSHPHIRYPPFGASTLQRPLQAVQDVLKAPELPGNMVILVSDGSRSIEANISNQCKDRENGFLKKNHTAYTIAYDEDSIKARKPLKGHVVQSEGLHMYVSATNPPKIPERARCVYRGTTRGTMLGPVVVDQYSSPAVWKIDPKLKKDMYAKAKPLTGGPCPEAEVTAKPLLNGLEPVTFHGMPRAFYKEVLHSWSVGCVINCTESDGALTIEAILAQKPVISILFSAEHGQHLRKRLRSLRWGEMLNPKSSLYESALAKMVKELEGEPDTEQKKGKGKGKSKKTSGDSGLGESKQGKSKGKGKRRRQLVRKTEGDEEVGQGSSPTKRRKLLKPQMAQDILKKLAALKGKQAASTEAVDSAMDPGSEMDELPGSQDK